METFFFDHWPFAAAVLVLASVGQIMKAIVWTKERAGEKLWAWYARKTLPVHPVVCGFAFGLLPGVTQTTQWEGWFTAPLYYATAGVMSTWAFSLVSGMLKSRGMELKTPDPVSMPPKPQDRETPVSKPPKP